MAWATNAQILLNICLLFMGEKFCYDVILGAFKVLDAPLPAHLAGKPFARLVEWLYRTSGFLLIGARAEAYCRPVRLARASNAQP